jgi:hypothetical protein
MIVPIKERKIRKVEIDLTGPDGNVFNLINIATDLAKLLNKRRGAEYLNIKALQDDMMSDDYEHAVKVMEKNFGHMIIMYR